MTTAQKQFDIDFQIVRKLVLKGKFTVQAAKDWLKKHGQVMEDKLFLECQKDLMQRVTLRADRELCLIREAEQQKRAEGEDEDDD